MDSEDKLLITKISNYNSYNEMDIEKSQISLDRLQEFVVGIGVAKVTQGEYEVDGKSYDIITYYTLFYDDPKDDFEQKKRRIDDLGDGAIVRYFDKEIDLLIIFLQDKIKLIFYCDNKNRERIITSLLNFCKIISASL